MTFCSLVCLWSEWVVVCGFFFFQAEDGIRDLVRSRGLGDVYKRQDEDIELRPSGRVVKGGDQRCCGLSRAAAPTLEQRLSLIHI